MVNLALNEAMSFEILRMSSETSLIWQSHSIVQDSGMQAPPDLTSSIPTISRSVRIYSILSLKPMDTGGRHWALGKPN